MSPQWDTAARLLLRGLLAWRVAAVLLRAAGLLSVWAGLVESATGAGSLAGVGALVLGGAVAWLAGRWLEGWLRVPLAALLAARRRSRRAG